MRILSLAIVLLLGLLAAPPASAQNVCPDNFVSFRGTSAPLACTCSADAAARGAVWGMDVYTEDSSICQAAVHAGIIPPAGGNVTVFPTPGQATYAGVTRNGISSSNWGSMDGSFAFAGTAPAAIPAPAAIAPPPPPASFASANLCPDNFVSFRGTTAPLTCGCSAEATERGAVWGMDTYTEDSSICAAAVHAGMIPAQGGIVTALPAPGQASYAGVTRNGISSSNWGSMDGSFRFTTAMALPAPVAATVQSAEAIGICPDNFVAFRGSKSPIACSCSAEATGLLAVWGMDVYTEDSGICQAAVHAGMIPAQGGDVIAVPMPGQSSYAGVTRNGVSSSNWGSMDGSFRFATAASIVPSAPVQLPIAASLAQQGEVQLYINFAFNSANLAPESASVLNELLGALRADPSLNLTLIGHTDSIGSPDYNLVLSAQRAESVKTWLVQQGIQPFRLATAGRGASEPIADNATDYGRAVNRRVQALRN